MPKNQKILVELSEIPKVRLCLFCLYTLVAKPQIGKLEQLVRHTAMLVPHHQYPRRHPVQSRSPRNFFRSSLSNQLVKTAIPQPIMTQVNGPKKEEELDDSLFNLL